MTLSVAGEKEVVALPICATYCGADLVVERLLASPLATARVGCHPSKEMLPILAEALLAE